MKTGRPTKFNEGERREIAALFLQGQSLKELARQRNCCLATIKAAIRAPYAAKVSVGKQPESLRLSELRAETEAALAEYLQGMSLYAVAKRANLPLSTLRHRLKIFSDLYGQYRAEQNRRDAAKLQSNLQKEAGSDAAEEVKEAP